MSFSVASVVQFPIGFGACYSQFWHNASTPPLEGLTECTNLQHLWRVASALLVPGLTSDGLVCDTDVMPRHLTLFVVCYVTYAQAARLACSTTVLSL